MTSTVASIERAGAPRVLSSLRRRAAALGVSWTALSVVFAVASTSVVGTIGPDARWLGALGRSIVQLGRIPHGIPFAAAPSMDWPNVPVLSELTFHGLQVAFGDRGLLAAQLVAIPFGLAVVAWDARRVGATDAATAAALALLVPAGLLAFAGIKAQLFSLAFFPLLVALLRAESRRPSRRIWLVVPLVALWSNLHGAVLVGLAVAFAYLAFDRMRSRRVESLALAITGTPALCATPALERTPHYYV